VRVPTSLLFATVDEPSHPVVRLDENTTLNIVEQEEGKG
jgi:hypothetical protein